VFDIELLRSVTRSRKRADEEVARDLLVSEEKRNLRAF
jgi:hypothetical protein